MSDAGRANTGEAEAAIPEAVPAATLIVTRRGPDAPELLMMERAAHMAFAASALVFPGGRIDAGDRALAERIGGGIEDAAGRIAAIRETVEETGIGVGFAEPPEASALATLRAGLAAEEPFGALLDDL